jgi:hypothetical protein
MCAGITYSIYCNELRLEDNWTQNYYHHLAGGPNGFDNTVENTWIVRVNCEDGGESVPVALTKEPCIPCLPVVNLAAAYDDECCAVISWAAPEAKRIAEPLIFAQQTPPAPAEMISADRLPYVEGSETGVIEFGEGIKAYVADAFIGDTYSTGVGYYSVNLATGVKTMHAPLGPTEPFPTGEDYDGTNVYRLYADASVYKINADGTRTLMGTIPGCLNTVGLAYDWIANDGTWYFYDIREGYGNSSYTGPWYPELCKFNMTTLTRTLVGKSTAGNFLRGLAMAEDGFLYAIDMSNSGITKFNRTTGQLTAVGPMGVTTGFGQDLAYDRVEHVLYASPLITTAGNIPRFGTINRATGAFTMIYQYPAIMQHATLVVAKSSSAGSGKYNIYRNGELIAENHPEPTYTDCGFDPFLDHEWTITQVCAQAEFGESDPVSVSLLACACHPPQNLTAAYLDECAGAVLNWDVPQEVVGGKNGKVYEFVTPAYDNLEKDALKESGTMATGNAVRTATHPIAVIETPSPKGDIPRAPKNMVNVTLQAGNVWGDGTGYQMLIGPTSLWGSVIPETGPLFASCSAPATLYDPFTYKIPTNANPVCNTSNIVISNAITIQIPAGTYSYCIVNPTPGDRLWIAGGDNGRKASYTFEAGNAYNFTAELFGSNDRVVITITDDGDPCDVISNLNVSVVNNNDVALTWNAAPGTPTGYQVLFNGTALATVTGTSYTHTNVAPGTHNYCVRAIYAGDCIPFGVCQSVTVQEYFGICEARVVGTGTTGQYQLPINTFYRHSYVQQVYDAAEIGDPGLITQIAFNFVFAGAVPTYNNQTIYLGHTNKSTFANTSDWIPVDQLTQVYVGSINWNNSTPWFTIVLDEPFEYEGGNLVLAYLNNHGDYHTSTSNTFNTTATTGNKTIHYRVDGIPPVPINPATVGAATGVLAQRANTRFIMCPNLGLYNIYRDGEPIALEWPELTYYDMTMNPFFPHCWEVRAICTGDGRTESDPITVCLPICKDVTPWLVFGVIQAADGNNIVGATLQMVESSAAFLEYNATSVTDGRFEFENVFKTTYTLTITKPGYQVHTQSVVVDGHTNLGTIILYDIPYPPVGNVVATEINNESSLIEWNLPATLPLSVRGIVGYKLWRFVEGNQNNPGTWTILTNNPVAENEREFVDNGWNGLTTGEYMYAVRTCYSGGVESEPAFSNVLQKWNNVVYTINITCDNGANPTGALITLTNKNEADFVYTAISGNTGWSFPEVRQGKYDLTITLAGFENYADSLTVMEADTYEALLESIKYLVTFNVTRCATGEEIADATIVFNGQTIPGYTVNAPAGTHSYTVTKDEYNIATGTVTVVAQPVTVDVCISPIGIGEFELGEFNLYPSPASFNITVERGSAIPATIELYNAMGMHINQYETSEAKFEINVSSLSAGTYFIRVTEGEHTGVKSFVKK